MYIYVYNAFTYIYISIYHIILLVRYPFYFPGYPRNIVYISKRFGHPVAPVAPSLDADSESDRQSGAVHDDGAKNPEAQRPMDPAKTYPLGNQ